MRAQGMVEYALILVLVAIVMVVVLALLPGLFNTDNPCSNTQDLSFACRDYQVQQCVISEQYTREECIALVGGGK